MPQAAIMDRSPHGPPYKRHRPEQTLLYQVIEQRYPEFRDVMVAQGKSLPVHVQQEFADFLKCGRLEHGFLRVQCTACHHEHLVAFSCKRRGFCPSCGTRRMAESAALLVDEVFPEQPIRQWVLSFPFQLRFLFASRPELMGKVLSPRHRGPPDQKGWIHPKDCADRRGDADPAIRECIKSERTFSYALPRWCVRR